MFILFLFYIGAIVLGLFTILVGLLERKTVVIILGFSIDCITFYLFLFTLLGLFDGHSKDILTDTLFTYEISAAIIGFVLGTVGAFIKNSIFQSIFLVLGYTSLISSITLYFLLSYLARLNDI
ncbi:hypothetical protein [Ectobacillus sp. sgz5001026]|uniref:hypothetical protein n=1 Tax=Ectobacillus sp. sgz5001026 TaxID=3242473 RepID=UPI0036D23396